MAVSTFRQVARRPQGTGRPDPLGWSRPPKDSFWIPRELVEWPEFASLRHADIGVYMACAIWANGQHVDFAMPAYAKMFGATRASMERIVDAGLWKLRRMKVYGDVFAQRSMPELRAGRGRPGLLINVCRLMPDSIEALRAGTDGLGVWTLAAAYSLAGGEPGLVPVEYEREICTRAERRKLVDAGLWEPEIGGMWMPVGDHPYHARWAIVRDDERAAIDPALREFIYARDGYRCLECGTPDNLSLDHIIPWSVGGPDTEDNLQTLCRPHNSSKGARF